MIFIGNSPDAPVSLPPDQDIAMADLLSACASELRHQAIAMATLDTALGGILDLWRAGERRDLHPALLRDLQRADHLRQETEGLARVLDMLVQAGPSTDPIRSAAIRACTPLLAQQDRLLAACADATTGRVERGTRAADDR